jgi:hypothetical protein
MTRQGPIAFVGAASQRRLRSIEAAFALGAAARAEELVATIEAVPEGLRSPHLHGRDLRAARGDAVARPGRGSGGGLPVVAGARLNPAK